MMSDAVLGYHIRDFSSSIMVRRAWARRNEGGRRPSSVKAILIIPKRGSPSTEALLRCASKSVDPQKLRLERAKALLRQGFGGRRWSCGESNPGPE